MEVIAKIDRLTCYYTSKNLNFGWANDAKASEVTSSLASFENALLQSRSYKKVMMTKQIHGSEIAHVDSMNGLRMVHEDELPLALKNWNYNSFSLLDGYDGAITTQNNIVLMSFYADCTPIALYDPKRGVVGMAHSGWQGTVAEIGRKLVEEMVVSYDVNPKNLIAVIGPTAKKCCYEVDERIRKQFMQVGLPFDLFAINTGPQKYHLDMADINRAILIRAGVQESNIFGGAHCTICESDKWHSFRREGQDAGRAALILSLD